MSTDGDKGTPPRQVLVQLVLQVDEACVVELVELDVAEDGRGEVGPDLRGLRLDADSACLALHPEHVSERRTPGERREANGRGMLEGVGGNARIGRKVELEGSCDPLNAQQVVAVGRHLNLELVRFASGMVGVGGRLRGRVRSASCCNHPAHDMHARPRQARARTGRGARRTPWSLFESKGRCELSAALLRPGMAATHCTPFQAS